MPDRLASANPTATEDDAVVELRHCSACPWVAVTNLRRYIEAPGERSSCDAGLTGVHPSMKPPRDIANPIHSIDLEFLRHQVISIAHNHAIRRRIQIHNVARPR